MDWDTDKYSKAIFDIFYTNRNILIEFRSKNLKYYLTADLEDVKGWTGKGTNRGFAYISDHMIDVTSTTGWNAGGTLLHEVILHIHHTGINETAHPMQILYDLETSNIDHEGSPWMEWSDTEKLRLDNLRNNF